MTVTMNAPKRVGPRAWRLSWSSTESAPTYRVYRDGLLVAQTTATEITLSVDEGEAPVVQVLDTAAAVPDEGHPGRATLGWYAVLGADHYRVEEYVATVWTLRKIIRDRTDGAEGYFRWRSRPLEDSADHRFRARAVDAEGDEATIMDVTWRCVRHPDPPRATYTYAAGTGAVTLAAS